LQDKEEDEEPQWYNTHSQTMSVMQEAMLACVDISKPTFIASQDLGLLSYREKSTFKISTKQLSTRKTPMTWFCEMTNSVLGEKGKLLEYWHLIGNPKTKSRLGPLIWKQNWMTSPGNAREEHGNKHHLFHPTGPSSM
jgi:hypothetical protein